MKTQILITLLLLSMAISACGGAGASAEAGGEASGEDPMAQLEAMKADLTTKMETAKAPIDKTETLVGDLKALPGKLSISEADFNAAVTSTIETGQIEISGELAANAEAKAEIEALLTQVQTISADLKATPDNAKLLMETAGQAAAKLPVLASEASAQYQAKINAPLGVTAEAKAEAQAKLDELAAMQEDITAQIESAKSLSAELPQMATEALATFTATFAAGAAASAG